MLSKAQAVQRFAGGGHNVIKSRTIEGTRKHSRAARGPAEAHESGNEKTCASRQAGDLGIDKRVAQPAGRPGLARRIFDTHNRGRRLHFRASSSSSSAGLGVGELQRARRASFGAVVEDAVFEIEGQRGDEPGRASHSEAPGAPESPRGGCNSRLRAAYASGGKAHE